MRILRGIAQRRKYFLHRKYKIMQNLFILFYTAVLFYLLTPGILLTIPSRSSKMVVAATHALVFALVFKLTHRMAWKFSMSLEGFQESATTAPMSVGSLPTFNTVDSEKLRKIFGVKV
jgi:hypothetical protein